MYSFVCVFVCLFVRGVLKDGFHVPDSVWTGKEFFVFAIMSRLALGLVQLISKLKRPEPDSNQSLPSNVEIKEYVELYPH